MKTKCNLLIILVEVLNVGSPSWKTILGKPGLTSTISFQVIKAAVANPVMNLRSE